MATLNRCLLVAGVVLGWMGPASTAQMGGAYAEVVPDRQFHANFSETTVRTMADGTVQTRVTHGVIARDAQGRSVKVSEAENDSAHIQYGLVNDPVARLAIRWNSRDKVATVTHYTAPAGPNQRFGYYVKTLPTPGYCTVRNPVSRTNLGERIFDGSTAQGCIQTLTRPADAGENGGKPVEYSVEDWTWKDLDLEVLGLTKDPSHGVTTWTVNNMLPTEPDASLFQVPAGYTVKDVDSSPGVR